MSRLKQGTISFTSAKQTNITPNGKSQERTLRKNRRTETPTEDKNDAKTNEFIDISSDEEGEAAEITVPAKQTRTSTKAQTTKQTLSQPSQSEKKISPSPEGTERKSLDVEDKAGHYRKHYNEVRSKIGHTPLVHAEGQNRIHQMLRFFDMSYEFGPCIGMTRLERWERAEAFGLDPPVEVRDILLTKEGIEKAEYAQCVLDGEV